MDSSHGCSSCFRVDRRRLLVWKARGLAILPLFLRPWRIERETFKTKCLHFSRDGEVQRLESVRCASRPPDGPRGHASALTTTGVVARNGAEMPHTSTAVMHVCAINTRVMVSWHGQKVARGSNLVRYCRLRFVRSVAVWPPFLPPVCPPSPRCTRGVAVSIECVSSAPFFIFVLILDLSTLFVGWLNDNEQWDPVG